MSLNQFLEKIQRSPDALSFKEVMNNIDQNYDYEEVAFTNGEQHNRAGENSGSCKVFSFALMHNLNIQQTLALFAEYYRQDVLMNPDAEDHQNIRQFIKHGFSGLSYENQALIKKTIA